MLCVDGILVVFGFYGIDDFGCFGVIGMVDKYYFEWFGVLVVFSIVGGVLFFVVGLNVNGISLIVLLFGISV